MFSRNSEQYTFDSQVDEWINLRRRIIGLNMMHDHRISRRRGKRLETCFKCRNEQLENAVRNYFHHQVRQGDPPDFIDPEVNRDNIITGSYPNPAPAVSPAAGAPSPLFPRRNTRDTLLVRALIINGLKGMFNASRAIEPFVKDMLKYFPCGFANREFEEALDRAMYTAENKAFVDFVLQLIRFWTPGYLDPQPVGTPGYLDPQPVERYPFQPTWVALWDEFQPFADHPAEDPLTSADRWLQALGIYSEKPQWVILLGYPAQEAGNLVRPTQLDAGWNEYHFPSPPGLAPDLGGHPVDLGLTRPRRLISEFIHQQIQHPFGHYERLGCRSGRTTGQSVDLQAVRQRHYHRLLRRYGSDLRDWMPKPI